MPTVQVEAQLSSEDLLHAVEQLDSVALDVFLGRVNTLRAGRRAAHLSEQETELLLKINAGLPEATWKRYDLLNDNREAETLTLGEHQELLRLIDVVEIDNAHRIGYLIELAHLRQTTLDALMHSLGIGPRRRA